MFRLAWLNTIHIHKLTSYINTIDEQYGDRHRKWETDEENEWRWIKRKKKNGMHSTISKWFHYTHSSQKKNKLINIHSSLALLSIMHGNNHKKKKQQRWKSVMQNSARMYLLFDSFSFHFETVNNDLCKRVLTTYLHKVPVLWMRTRMPA